MLGSIEYPSAGVSFPIILIELKDGEIKYHCESVWLSRKKGAKLHGDLVWDMRAPDGSLIMTHHVNGDVQFAVAHPCWPCNVTLIQPVRVIQ